MKPRVRHDGDGSGVSGKDPLCLVVFIGRLCRGKF